VEYFIFRDCFVEELLLLHRGLVIDLNDRKFFLKARMLLTILDTKGWEEFFHTQGSNSKVGCLLCNKMRGRFSKKLDKSIYDGEHRKGLPITHIWRYFGQAGCCCPIHEFDGDEATADETTSATNISKKPQILKRNNIFLNKKLDWSKLCCFQGTTKDVEDLFPITTNFFRKLQMVSYGISLDII
jgi:hypothetical protein